MLPNANTRGVAAAKRTNHSAHEKNATSQIRAQYTNDDNGL